MKQVPFLLSPESYFNCRRRKSTTIHVGPLSLGGDSPIRLQSMTTHSTMDTPACVEQSKKIVDKGGEIVRLTTQGTREAANLAQIKEQLRREGYDVPLVADVHFNPAVADVAAGIVEGVRINPGNYVDAARTFKHLEYTEEEYQEEIRKIEERLKPFLEICRRHHTAVRIGVNHGSLSDRIMSRYGDTPQGIVESCMEFLRVFQQENFNDVVISIKASDASVMVESVRLLVSRMEQEGMEYPLHLGVTEAGEGEDGRIKSALGIGTLLADGIGDTIRVSLSEEPEDEIPVAAKIRDHVALWKKASLVEGHIAEAFNYLCPQRRKTVPVGLFGGQQAPVVIASRWGNGEGDIPDFKYCGVCVPATGVKGRCIVDASVWNASDGYYPAFNCHQLAEAGQCSASLKFLILSKEELDDSVQEWLLLHPEVVVVLQSHHAYPVGEYRTAIHQLMIGGIQNPVVISRHYGMENAEDFQLAASMDMGALLFDGLCDGIWLDAPVSPAIPCRTAFAILQGAGLRRTRTEYISCPGCGRTLYDLQGTIARIKSATQGLPNLKIAVMGCIVNGPGEMAGADYGYVGAARGKISLYRGKECVEKNIMEEEAVDHLLQLLRNDGYLK